MFGIRQKIILGVLGMLAIVFVIGAVTVRQIGGLGKAIDVILRENYRSVVACQDMKEALGRMESGALSALLGNPEEGARLQAEAEAAFRRALDVELHNITLPGERERAAEIDRLFPAFAASLAAIDDVSRSPEARKSDFLQTALPLSRRISAEAQVILEMNQRNMESADMAARARAAASRRRMLFAFLACLVVTAAFGSLVNRWVLKPIRALTVSAEEIERGNLEMVVADHGRDEVAKLARAFNGMTAGLREARRNQDRQLYLCRRATDEVFRALPEALAVIDPVGRVEVGTEDAGRIFGLKAGASIRGIQDRALAEWVDAVLGGGRAPEAPVPCLQRFDAGRERFFEPAAFPILSPWREPTGYLVHLRDVTQIREQEELKRGVVATVSHQLKTPLTSLRMSIHLLLQEPIGPLNARQAELLLAAREDSERLSGIIEGLLEIERIAAGKAPLDLRPAAPAALIRVAVEAFLPEARDRGVRLEAQAEAGLPDVLADEASVREVFANLLQNALRFTSAGGAIAVSAESEADAVRFAVRDTGRGVPPDLLPRLFEEFVRGPGQEESPGAGLGLAIVRKIVAAHGGSVGAESEENRGSTFWFTLPRAGTGGPAEGRPA